MEEAEEAAPLKVNMGLGDVGMERDDIDDAGESDETAVGGGGCWCWASWSPAAGLLLGFSVDSWDERLPWLPLDFLVCRRAGCERAESRVVEMDREGSSGSLSFSRCGRRE